jgi:hypothetical protein
MRKFSLILASIILIAGATLCHAQAYQLAYYPMYWVGGTVAPAEGAPSADGKMAVYFASTSECNNGIYAYDTIGAAGISGQSNKFMINTFSLMISTLSVGSTYYVAIPNSNPTDPASGYGADPVAVIITGTGLDILTSPLVYRLGGGEGINPPAAPQGPLVKIWFGNRLYQTILVERGEPFVIPSKPDMKIELSVESPRLLSPNIADHSIVLDEGTTASEPLSLTVQNITSQTYAAGTAAEENKITAMSLSYPSSAFTVPLGEGVHTFTVRSKTSSTIIPVLESVLLAKVEVMGGPLRLIGTPLTYPSPFSISKQQTVYVQYTLSQNANMELYIIGVGGQRVKHFVLNAGAEGGSAGVNKVAWDGRTDQGYLAGNAIYVVTIIAKDEGKLLGRTKMTLVD